MSKQERANLSSVQGMLWWQLCRRWLRVLCEMAVDHCSQQVIHNVVCWGGCNLRWGSRLGSNRCDSWLGDLDWLSTTEHLLQSAGMCQVLD